MTTREQQLELDRNALVKQCDALRAEVAALRESARQERGRLIGERDTAEREVAAQRLRADNAFRDVEDMRRQRDRAWGDVAVIAEERDEARRILKHAVDRFQFDALLSAFNAAEQDARDLAQGARALFGTASTDELRAALAAHEARVKGGAP